MSSPPSEHFSLLDDPLEIAVAAAMGRQHTEDARSFLRGLADLVEAALPGEATVTRSGLFGGDKRPVKRIEVTFAEAGGTKQVRYVIEDPGSGPLAATRTQMVRGVALKTEPLEASAWIEAVSAAIARRADESRATRDALKRLL